MKTYPEDGAIVWVEAPPGRWRQGRWEMSTHTFSVKSERPIREDEVAAWSPDAPSDSRE